MDSGVCHTGCVVRGGRNATLDASSVRQAARAGWGRVTTGRVTTGRVATGRGYNG